MKRIGIVTITNSGLNFGNRLQNYALQEQLKKEKLAVETIYSANAIAGSLILSKIRRTIKHLVKRSRRRQYFQEFDRKYIDQGPIVRYGDFNQELINERYDAFVAGSDQVWNPHFHFNSEFEFMTFAPSKKRYSYSASFGVDQLDEPTSVTYKRYLENIQMISVRENTGGKLVEELTGRKAGIHPDPCMLMTKEAYRAIAKKPPMGVPEQYLLTYMLGNHLKAYDEFVQVVANKKGLPIVALSETPEATYYAIGPQHFVYLIEHCSYLCTDSFHGTVYAILFEKNFTVFKRKDNDAPMDDRLATLLKNMDLEDRRFGLKNVDESLEPIDYEPVRQRLETERNKGQSYIHEMAQHITSDACAPGI